MIDKPEHGGGRHRLPARLGLQAAGGDPFLSALVGDGKVSWDSRIRDIDPGFALQDELASADVTVGDLFAHRSGLPGHVGDDIEELGFSQGEILHKLRLAKPAYGFRNGYAYSNFGLTEGAVAAARVAGKGWESVAEERLYKPLGMNATSSRYRDFMSLPNRASLHVRVDGAGPPSRGAMPMRRRPPAARARRRATWRSGCGCFADGRFDGHQLIDKAALQRAHVPAIVRGIDPATGAAFYGFGWNVDYREHGVEWSHAGAFSAGARTLVRLIPGAQLGVVVLANAFPVRRAGGHRHDVLRPGLQGRAVARLGGVRQQGLRRGLRGYDEAEPRLCDGTRFTPSRPDGRGLCRRLQQRLCWRGQGRGRRRRTLFLLLGPAGRRLPLTHFNRDVFTYSPMAEAPKARIGVNFLIGPDGKAAEITIEDLNDYGLGTLARTGTN